ncbi:MAG: serine--tRNA ligase [Bacteroidia bacterium]|nr:serine--tRNA ligase [Bacteroidia bacterium]MCF8427234.1 serine--tRNA ligase [Bacteroidia bacterium]MCF8448139.1 serine--tRNA ligase [Bacteroidia bacterium]
MLALNYLREQTQDAKDRLSKRNPKYVETIDTVLAIDEENRKAKAEMEKNQSEANGLAKRIGELMKSGDKAGAEELKAQTAKLKEAGKGLEERSKQLEQELFDVLVSLPNTPHESVPLGQTAEENITVYQNGDIPTLAEDALPHWDLIKKYDLIDFELGAKISGAGFPVYKGKGARLQRAMINFFLDQAIAAGFTEIQPPLLVNAESGFGTGQLPDKEGQMYHATVDDLYLIPTAEVPITNIYRDVILKEEDLPIKNVGYTPCFRREAGAWGAHVRGLNRLHQFDKVEIVQIAHPDQSYALLDEMVIHVKGLLEKLELPYRILHLCGGDMSFTSALTYDFETYSAAQGRWLEVSSTSNFESFQANRLKCRFKNKEGKNQLAHTLNGSALALPRILATLLENNQTPEGIRIPAALVPYCGFDMIS